MNKAQALIIDDEADIRELLEITLNRMDIETKTAENLSSAQVLLKEQTFNLCLTDMRLPDGDGLDLLSVIQAEFPQLPVIVITAHGSAEAAVKAMKQGAFDFLSKPVDLKVLRQLVRNALKANFSPTQDRRSRNTLLGESEAMCQIRAKISKIARSQAPVYIKGESGSGKELVASLIHKKSARSDAPFIAVNCGAIPAELMESEFFGHKKGSFTGANGDKQGLFQAAEGGTLFLDEVADLPLVLQVKLLRAIQEKKVRAIGSQQEEAVDVRLLSATHKDLAQLVQEGIFRQDLYYRINVIELNVPALRNRKEDIIQLSEFFLSKIARNNQFSALKFSSGALKALKQYKFPGNVRELENILERAVALHDGDIITEQDLDLRSEATELPDSEAYDPMVSSLEEYLEEIEKQAISDALEQNKWNRTATAKQLGMSFRSLRYRLKKLGLES
ncbi:sigma-54-dependent transcriptional regulator [methanotrophic endosymbiont of Bathymodiolus puteoserpentis (Logatchev)]|jgi:two-component system response regulator PilR (NtrC family)|uniref:sigma-54-dependent transcriptional regulator n=1 Tax=methanotrophic endosymbiont of Bathymodiolus puteoserpentis (Logatchev) TaxID=343235 RepID=UPI0013C9DA7F|nr:sigma-54 dependent transcriptional regulator [methanotrophic endosymbiont of Bathymodiolus puteoserpentis (Logatchev)]SHE20911.1 Type IV fimbriae expression regulatory protein PilR [methanotrophic endosymbiont of Bathymodiolus puteoserpentis (Logatchev)]